jgi:predicted transcriptional regulator
MPTDKSKVIDLYQTFLGELKGSKTELIADTCPACGAKKKFSISKSKTTYHCLRCGVKGNKYTFMTMMNEIHLSTMTKRDRAKISKLRGGFLSTSFIEKMGLCIDSEYIYIPVRNVGKTNLSNYRRWNKGNKVLYNLPSCSTMYVAKYSENGPIYLCEGEWDAISLMYLMERAKYTEECCIFAVPGAETFKDEWAEKFQGRDVYLLYDNDFDKERPTGEKFNPGIDGMTKTAEKLSGIASSVKRIFWEEVKWVKLTDGFDLRDYTKIACEKKKTKLYLRKLFAACKQMPNVEKGKKRVPILKRESFDEVVTDFQKSLEFNRSFQDVLACCFACVISLDVEIQQKNPLWLFIVAPPSMGKTTIIEAFTAVKRTKHVSELTPAALVAGVHAEDGSDPSLLAKLPGNVLFNEDFTPILTSGQHLESILGILRAAFNGEYTAKFARFERHYDNLYFGLVSGVTHAIENTNNLTDLGERFLRIRLLDESFKKQEHTMRALRNVNATTEESSKEFLQGSVAGYVNHMRDNIYTPDYPDDYDIKISYLAEFVALCRTSVPRDRASRDMVYRPQPEAAARIGTQLKKMVIALAVVFQTKEVNDDCYRVTRKLALDSCVGWKLEVITILMNERHGLSKADITIEMGISANQTNRILEDCQQIGMVKRVSKKVKHKTGRQYNYMLTDMAKELVESAEIDSPSVRKTFSNKTKRKNQHGEKAEA